jgi:predicted O-methyltransferase YrrM
VTNRNLQMNDALAEYLLRIDVREPDVLRQLRLETAQLPDARMQIGPDQGKLMRWLVELISAKACLEIGVFTGYSSISVALGLPDDGQLVACDNDPRVVAVAERYFGLAGVAHKIRLELGIAVQTLQRLVDEGMTGQFDFAFIDADKESYDDYYEYCLKLLRPGGLVLLDNTLWGGKVFTAPPHDADTSAIIQMNLKIAEDPRVSGCLVPIGDGLTLVRKR